MEIWLKHPQHGVKCAYIVAEAENDEKNGWIRFDPNEKEAEEAVAPVDSDSQDAPTFEEAPKKRGRPAMKKG